MNFRCILKAAVKRFLCFPSSARSPSVCLNPVHTIRKVSFVCPQATLHKFKHWGGWGGGVCDRGNRMSCLSKEELWNGHYRPQAFSISPGIEEIKHSHTHTHETIIFTNHISLRTLILSSFAGMRFIYYIYSLIFVLSVVSGPHKGLLKYSLNLSDSQHWYWIWMCMDIHVLKGELYI